MLMWLGNRLRRRSRFSNQLTYAELRHILGAPGSSSSAPSSAPSAAVLGSAPPTLFWGCGCQAGVIYRLRSGEALYWAKSCSRHRRHLHGRAAPFLLLADVAAIDDPLPSATDSSSADCESLLLSVTQLYPAEVPRVFAEPIGEFDGTTLRDLVERGEYRLANHHLSGILERSPELRALHRTEGR